MTLNVKHLDRFCLGLVVITCLICGAWIVKQGIRQKRQIQRDNEMITRKLQELDLAKIKSQGLQSMLKKVADDLEVLNAKIPQTAEVGSFLKNVDGLVTSLNLVLINVQPFPAVSEKLYTRIPIKLTFTGAFTDTYRLLWKLETMNRLLVMEKISISQDKMDAPCRVDLTANIFQRDTSAMRTAIKLP